jgi:hypothetical protein
VQNAREVAFITKEMVKHLVNLLFVNGQFMFLIHKKAKSVTKYNIKLIGQPTNHYKFSAAIIGLSSVVIAILIVFVFDQDVMVIIAAVFISLGTGRQIFASALDIITTNLNSFLSSWASTLLFFSKNRQMETTTTTDWAKIESQVKLILISTQGYNPPVELDKVKPETQHILLEYLNKHGRELGYHQTITNDDPSCLVFAQYAVKRITQNLLIYYELEDLQERSGGVNAVILIALGTLIWLIS